MSSEPLVAKGIRLHPALWRRIESEARSQRCKPGDLLRRKIEVLFDFDPEVHDLHHSGSRTTQTLTLRDPE